MGTRIAVVLCMAFSFPAYGQDICREVDEGRAICSQEEVLLIRGWMANAKAIISNGEISLDRCQQVRALDAFACSQAAETVRRFHNIKVSLLRDQLEASQQSGAWRRFWASSGWIVAVASVAIGAAAGAVVTWRALR